MRKDKAIPGTWVKVNREFVGVPKGTRGIIDEDYGSGVMVAWDLPDRPLPRDYKERYAKYARRPQIAQGQPLRDGFDKETELQHLELIDS